MLLILSQLSFLLTIIALWGILVTRKNIIVILIAFELLMFSINFSFVVSSLILDDTRGQLYALYILSVVGAESAIGLALLVNYFRLRGDITVDSIRAIKG